MAKLLQNQKRMARDDDDDPFKPGKALVKHKDGKKEGNRRERRKAAAVDNTFRRTWDQDEFEEKASEREKVHATCSALSCAFL